jgi:hypothetical protein
MNLFGAHGMSLAGLILILAAVPLSLLTWFGKWLHPDTHLVIVTAYGICAVAGSAIFLTLDVQAGGLLGVPLWFALIGAVVYSVCWAWKRARRVAITGEVR